jgi:TetR/AcrR family transcriptional regulator, tetracycline repressor protein
VSSEQPVRIPLDGVLVVDAALALVDAEGLGALTVRRLAQSLRVSPTALYWHFEDKQAVLDALGDRLWEKILERLGPDQVDDAWAEIRMVFEAIIFVFRRHRKLAPLAPGRFVDSPAGLAVTERTLVQLARVGYEDRSPIDAARFLVCSALVLVTGLPAALIPDVRLREEHLRRKRAALTALPPGQYPELERVSEYLFGSEQDSDPYYKFAVDLIIDGLRFGAGTSASR